MDVERERLLATAVKQRRDTLGMTQLQLSEKARVALSTIIAVEDGKPGKGRIWEKMQARTREPLMTALQWTSVHDSALRDGKMPPNDEVPAFDGESDVTGDFVTDVRDRLSSLQELLDSARVPDPDMLSYYVFECFDDTQRRMALRGITRWVAEHPDYARELGA